MTIIDRLYDLQRFDSRLGHLEGQLAGLDDGASLRANVERLNTEVEAAQRDLHAKQAQLRLLELELESTAGKARKMEQDLYSGRITNPKELAALQEDTQVLSRQRGRLEDEILGRMEEIERQTDQIQALEGSRSETQRALEAHLERYRSGKTALTAEFETVREDRAKTAAGFDPALLRRYELLRDRMGGVAVAAVVGGICEGCHVAIPERRLAQLTDPEADHIYTCERCGRILYAKAS